MRLGANVTAVSENRKENFTMLNKLESEEKRTRANRFAISMDPAVLNRFNRMRHAWYETPEEVKAGLAWGKRKAELMRWVRRQIGRRLTECERRCIELYYFEGMSFRQAAAATDTNVSSVHRAVARALRKLRQAAQEDGIALHRRTRPRGQRD
jgi:RNA polymerase sigma factor (sigma-70 family)